MEVNRISTRVSTRKLWTLLGAILVIGAAVTCHHDDNNVTGPQPVPVGTPVPGATPTPMPTNQAATVDVGQGGGTVFVDQQSGNSTTTIKAGSTVKWVWVNGTHSTTSGTCPAMGGACNPDGNWDSGIGSGMSFSHTFSTPGTFHYFCRVHEAMMQGMVVVQ